MITLSQLRASEERKEEIIDEISVGSKPGFRFYALLATASLIAAFGLIANSTAVIIGAMLVSPLMTPIIGISLAIVIGRPHLLGISIRSVIIGVVLSIFFAGILGFIPLALEATPEMLIRTKPTILDLFVAILAGFAGAFTMIDEKSSPVLPGVAIATAIIPPLSNTGLSLALGHYYGAFGSFMLFFANFLSILIVAGITFVLAGLNPWWLSLSSKDVFRRFGVALVGFAIVAIFLTYSLIAMVKERYLGFSIKEVLDSEFQKFRSSSLDSFIYDKEKGKLYVLANVRSPKIINPDKVEEIQKTLSGVAKLPTELIVRNVISKDVAAVGSTGGEVIGQNLDGFFLNKSLTDEEKALKESEQIFLEKLSYWPGMDLIGVEYAVIPRGPTIIATIQGYRNLSEPEIEELEHRLKEKLENPELNLIVRNVETSLSDRRGRVLTGWRYTDDFSDEQEYTRIVIDEEITAKFREFDALFPVNIHHSDKGDLWDVLVEAVGINVISPEELNEIEESISNKVNRKVNIDIWYRADTVITDKGYVSFEQYTDENITELDKYLREKNVDKTRLNKSE
jgi:uncharacterized hydrophobic protein (TIGR00271 family)